LSGAGPEGALRVCVVGAGAIGGLMAAALARAGHRVAVVARGAHLAAIRDQGLAVKGGDSAYAVPVAASADPADFGAQDVVVVALKAYSIGPMLPRLAPLLGPRTAVVTAINGLPWWYFQREGGRFDGSRIACLDPDGAMAAALDPGHLLGCVVHASAEVTAPGEIHHTSGAGFILGEIDGAATPRLERFAAAMRGAGFDPVVSARIRDDIWTKLIGNLSYNPVAALTGALMSEINANPALIDLIRRMMLEGMAVGAAYGVRFSVTIEERFAMARRLGSAKISMLQDMERGRPLELDAIVGAVTELGRRAGVATPAIDGVEALIRERARHVMPR
jgi:2-dehydropantoate 2-reductase